MIPKDKTGKVVWQMEADNKDLSLMINGTNIHDNTLHQTLQLVNSILAESA